MQECQQMQQQETTAMVACHVHDIAMQLTWRKDCESLLLHVLIIDMRLLCTCVEESSKQATQLCLRRFTLEQVTTALSTA
jgi:hypothetical protein